MCESSRTAMVEPARGAGRSFAAEFLIASAVCGLCILFVFHKPLLTGQVDSLHQSQAPPPQSLIDLFDPVSQVMPALFVQARQVRRGIFPWWSPDSQGGTPLIGKMQNGVFAPPHLLLYLLPEARLPYAFMLVIALQIYLAYGFTYLYARVLGLDMVAGIVAGLVFISFSVIRGELLPNSGVSGLYQPLLLLVVELYCRGQRPLARYLIPWAAALPFLAGHFESAFYVNLTGGLYLCARLHSLAGLSTRAKLARAFEFAGLMLLGLLLAGIQIVPGLEYAGLSYNRVWHDRRWFDFWDYESIQKHLTWEDAGLLTAGLAGIGVFAAAFRGVLGDRKTSRAASWLLATGALAFGVACLANLGLGDPLTSLTPGGRSAAAQAAFLLLLTISFWDWSREERGPLKILGWLAIGGIVLVLKTPPATNVLIHIPPFGNLHNAGGARWELQIAMAVLSAAAFQRGLTLSRAPWTERFAAASRVLLVLSVFVVGCAGARGLKDPVARLFPAGTAQPDPAFPGGIMGPRKQTAYGREQAIRGWIPRSMAVSSISLGFLRDGKWTAEVDATAGAHVKRGRRYFEASVPLPSEAGFAVAVARITAADGTRREWRGTEFDVHPRKAAAWLPPAVAAAFPLMLLLGPLPAKALAAAAVGLVVHYEAAPMPADQIPYQLAGINKIKEDGGRFRIHGAQNFLRADYANAYGLADLRIGGDFLDLLSMVYFNELCVNLLSAASMPRMYDAGLRLLGLGNVKYLVVSPGTVPAHPALKEHSRSTDMSVFRNERWLPRALFFDRHVQLPVADWGDWPGRLAVYSQIGRWLGEEGLDVGKTLILHDPLRTPLGAPEDASAKPSVVDIERYEPDEVLIRVSATRRGLVFLSDNHFPGWQAFVNGVETKILRSWLTFRAVEVPVGESEVVFRYRPLPLRCALVVSACLSLLWAGLYRRSRSGRAPVVSVGPAEPAWLEPCAVLTERIVVSLAAAMLAFWAGWSAFIYQGGIQASATAGRFSIVNVGGAAALAAFGVLLLRGARSRGGNDSRSPPTE